MISALRSLLLRIGAPLGRPRKGEALLYVSQRDRALHLIDDQGTDTTLGAGGGTTTIPPDIEIRPDGNPTLATGYEVVRGVLRTAHQYTTTTARSIAAASPEYGWTWSNRTNLTTADENTTTANASYGKVTTTNSDWTGGAQTAPTRYQTLYWDGTPLEVVALCYSNGAANYEGVGIVICSDATPGTFIKPTVGATAGVVGLNAFNGTTLTSATSTTGERDAGIWIRVTLMADNNGQAHYVVSYNKTASASPPTTWTVLQRQIVAIPPGTTIRIGQLWQSTNTAGNLAGGHKWFGIFLNGRPMFEQVAPAFFHGRQYDTSAAAQTLIASFDLGDSSAAISDTDLRAALAAAENCEPEDSGATWTYSAVRGSSPSPAAGSYSAAGSVSVSGTGRYFALYAKCTSSGSTHGSFDLGAFRLRAAV